MGYCVFLFAILAVTSSVLHGFPDNYDDVADREKRSTSYAVSVATDSPHHSIDKKFLSVAIGARLCTRLGSFKTWSPKLQNLAKGLAPAAGRIGGTYGAFIIYSPPTGNTDAVPADVISEWESSFNVDFYTGKVGKKKWFNKFCNGQSFVDLAQFYSTVGWDFSIQMNHLLRKDRAWDPSNARALLQHLKSNNIQLDQVQLTNEVNSYGVKFNGYTISAAQVAADFETLRELLDEEGFASTQILGPDVTSLTKSYSVSYLNATLQSGLGNTVDAITYHHFFMSKKDASPAEFTNEVRYNGAQTMMQKANSLKESNGLSLPVYVTETASASSGGYKDYSNRMAGAMSWIDSLGLVAFNKGDRMNRQTFWSGNYGMTDFKTFDPTPSYWTSVVFKRLIEGGVLTATATPNEPKLRVYSNCARTDGSMYDAQAGDVVVYYVNLKNETVTMTLPDYADKEYNLFLFSSDGLTSNNVYLNGNSAPVALDGDNLPTLSPATQTGGSIDVAAYGIGFIHVKGAQASGCSA